MCTVWECVVTVMACVCDDDCVDPVLVPARLA